MLEDFAKRMRWEMHKSMLHEFAWLTPLVLAVVVALAAVAFWLWQQN